VTALASETARPLESANESVAAPLVVNVAAHLPAMARLDPSRKAVIVPHGRDRSGRVAYTHLTALQLDQECDRIAHGLEAIGITKGVRTALLVTPSLDFFALVFALMKVGAVMVLVDPGIGPKNLGTCLAEAEPAAFIGIPKAHLARLLLGWAKRTAKILVTVGPRLLWGGTTLDAVRRLGDGRGAYAMPEARPDDPAAILFTSGGTGVPKGALYTHAIFAAQVELLRATYGIAPGEVDLATFPLFALFGPALGMSVIVPDMDASRPAQADPRKLAEAIIDQGATNMFGSPALVDNLGRWCAREGVRLPSLRRVISAGAPVPARVIERLTRALDPAAQVFTPYGATESLPVASIGSREIFSETRAATEAGRGICVGRPVARMRVRVIRITDDPIEAWSDDLLLPSGETGEIVVDGPVVTREYWNRPAATKLAKIREASTGAVIHRMGDVGYLDAQGRVWFCGRKVHRVATREGTLFTIPCEGVFNAHPSVRRTALVGTGPAGAKTPALCVELDREAAPIPEAQLFRELAALGAAQPHTRAITRFLVHPSFPVDIRHNAKIFREKLAAWAEGRLT